MTSAFKAAAVLLSISATVWSVNAMAARRTYTIIPERSRAFITVGKAGALAFAAGHTHEVMATAITGTVEQDTVTLAQSTVTLEIPAAALRVTGKGEPPDDVPKVQQVMLSDRVLDVQHHPTISFQSTGLTIVRQTNAAAELALEGRLLLHGVARPVKVLVHVEFTKPDTLIGRGQLRVNQTDFAIAPVSVAGVVKVKDALDIEFTIVAVDRSSS